MLEYKQWKNLVAAGEWFHLAKIRFFKGRLSRPHTHDFPELFFIEDGTGLHEINGNKKKLFSGDFVWIRAKDRHRLESRDDKGFVLINIAFAPSLLRDLSRRHPELAALFPAKEKLPVRQSLSQTQQEWLQTEIRLLSEGARRRLPIESFLLGAVLRLATPSNGLERVLESLRTDGNIAVPSAPLPDWLAHACIEIARPENFPEGVPAFVKLAGRGPEHVARTCRALLGQSPTELINRLRIGQAARALRLGEKPILEVALECGFGNLSHFYELFRAAHGETPLRYRRAHRHGIV